MVISGALLVADILVVHSSARDQDINLQSVWFGKQKLVFVLLSVKWIYSSQMGDWAAHP